MVSACITVCYWLPSPTITNHHCVLLAPIPTIPNHPVCYWLPFPTIPNHHCVLLAPIPINITFPHLCKDCALLSDLDQTWISRLLNSAPSPTHPQGAGRGANSTPPYLVLHPASSQPALLAEL